MCSGPSPATSSGRCSRRPGESPEAPAALHEALPLRIERYVLQHLGERSLSAERIAAAHFMSVRQLYYVWASRNGETLGEWIMTQRLERASRALAAPTVDGQTIASVARRCGFADATHFTRRFREHYGVTPRDWRAMRGRADGLVTV